MNNRKAIVIPADKKEEFLSRLDHSYDKLMERRRKAVYDCDHCKNYCWYYDKCSKWNCEVDAREVHDCFEPTEE